MRHVKDAGRSIIGRRRYSYIRVLRLLISFYIEIQILKSLFSQPVNTNLGISPLPQLNKSLK